MHLLQWSLISLLVCAPLACVHEQGEEDTGRAPAVAAKSSSLTNETASFVTDHKDSAQDDAKNDCAPLATGGTTSGSAGKNGRGGRDDHNTQ